MKHLVPTLRTDKNGRVQIRHMQADDSKAPAAPLPLPQVHPATETAPLSDGQLFAMLKDAGYGYVGGMSAELALSAIREDDPGLPDLVGQLAAKGPDRALDEVLGVLDELIETAMSGQREADIAESRGHPADWREYAPEAAHPRGRNSLVLAYHLDCVSSESEAPTDAAARWIPDILTLDAVLRSREPEFNTKALDVDEDRARCRGLAALVIAELRVSDYVGESHEKTRRRVEDFAAWAGQREDIGEVVLAAKHAGTADHETVSQLIEERKKAEPALREGVL